jgi:uncharacterized protein involved in exopolysaccharide biosynthesis
MKFSEIESIMNYHGVFSLADIARTLSTTPQAVSNWKSRDQVPYHIVAKLNSITKVDSSSNKDRQSNIQSSTSISSSQSPITALEDDTVNLSDILITMAEQLKVIFIVPFIIVFLTFSYVQFIQQPQYVSFSKVLLPTSGGNLGGFAGLASQFGVNMPSGSETDLSSPSLFPELIRSRTFAENILEKKFYTKKFGKKLSLLAILNHGKESTEIERNSLVTLALKPLGKMLEFEQDPASTFSVIKVTASEPLFSKELADVALAELEALNRFYKSQTVNEKTNFIASRIASVENDLKSSETSLKEFNERNRQISSPALQLEQSRLGRDVEIQKGIYLTLKQQYELAKIEEVQESSIIQVLDRPQVPLSPSNINPILSVLLAGILGIFLGIMIGFIRSYVDNSDMDERKKIRRVKYLFKKKIKDIFQDRRIPGIVSVLMLFGLPLFLAYESKNPVFFGMYSAKLMLVNTVYILLFLSSIVLFIHLTRKNSN